MLVRRLQVLSLRFRNRTVLTRQRVPHIVRQIFLSYRKLVHARSGCLLQQLRRLVTLKRAMRYQVVFEEVQLGRVLPIEGP